MFHNGSSADMARRLNFLLCLFVQRFEQTFIGTVGQRELLLKLESRKASYPLYKYCDIGRGNTAQKFFTFLLCKRRFHSSRSKNLVVRIPN